jgi:hypothetical protein
MALSKASNDDAEEGGIVVCTFQCRQGTVKIRYVEDLPPVPVDCDDFSRLHLITTSIRLEFFPAETGDRKIAIKLPAAKVVELFGGREPCSDTFDSALGRVRGIKRGLG